MKTTSKDRGPLAYRMRKSVTYHEKSGSPLLILDRPLKVLVLNPSWRYLLRLLSAGEFVPFPRIVSLVGSAEPERMEIFLDNLARKGFLEREGIPTLAEFPFVSIIIPVRNRPEEIKSCLLALGQIDYPPEKLEVIVVDDASSDETPRVVSRLPVNLIVLGEHKQASSCRNLAAQRARGDILAFIDSDCVAAPLWLKELIPAFKDNSLGAVGGMVDSYYDEKGLDRYEEVKSSLNMGFRMRRTSEEDSFFYVPSCNLLVRRELFLKMGGFREDLFVGEDADFCWRLQDEGHYIEYRPVGRAYHKHRNKLSSFCARRFDYGTSEPLLQQLHPRRIKRMIFPPMESLFWGFAVLSIISTYSPLLVSSGIILLIDVLAKLKRVNRKAIPIKFPNLFLAVFRSYFSFFHHCCAFLSRYYLIWAIFIVPLFPSASTVILGAHLLTGSVEYLIKRPRLNPVSFLFYFSLEQLAYQSGVWWGCLKRFCFKPVNPQVASRPPLRAK